MSELFHLKNELSDRRVQIARLDRTGNLLDSDHTLLNLHPFIGQPALQQFDIFVGLDEFILTLAPDDPPLMLPLMHFFYKGHELLVNMEFHPQEECIVWLLQDNRAFLPRLRSMQQQRNDSMLLLEKIREQEKQLREINEQLRIANQELDRFAYIISHDLKAPLRGIRNLAGWISEDWEAGDTSQVPNNLQLLQERSRRMEQLINGVLKYSRAGREKTEPEVVNTADLLGEILDDLDAHRLANIELQGAFPTLMTHRIWLRQVFSNLISNALKYGSLQDNRVLIRVAENNGQYEFSIADNGAGIPEKDHSRIFEVFEVLGEPSYENTGIGLTIVQKLVRQNGGDIRVDQSELGGARFTFSWQ